MERSNLNEIEIKRHYIEVERYDWVTEPRRFSRIYHQRREKETAELVKRYANGAKILDIGCGTGLITRHLDCKLVVGLDINQWAIERAKPRSPGVEFIVADAENLPLRSSVFNTVICTQTLEHLPKPQNAVSEIFRVLQSGGLFIGSIPSKNPVWKLRNRLSSRGSPEEPFHHSCSIDELKLLLNDFRIIDIAYRAYYLILVFVAQKP
jgi:ubiquinone/menaquinone biosynthesis C-methylase UbiE